MNFQEGYNYSSKALARLRKREAAEARSRQQQLVMRPRASATEAGKMDRLTFDWAFKILSPNQEIGLDQDRIVSRSRELANDDTTMAKFLATVWKNVFGPQGIKLQSKILLQRGGKPDKVKNKLIEGGWKEWTKKRNCSLDQRLNWVAMQRIIARTVAIDGECFVHKHECARNPFGFALEIINSDRVDRTYGRNSPQILPNGNFLFMGVEADPTTGTPVAYHIFNRHPSEAGAGPRQRIRIPANEILHLYLPVRDNQWRGLPWALPAMWRMNMLKGYVEADVVANRVAACQMGIITRDVDPDAAYSGEGGDPGRNYKGEQNIPMEAGAFGRLAPGEAFTQFKPERPVATHGEFVKSSKMDIATGLDAAYMTLSGDVGAANYSSARVGLLDERDTWEGLQGFFIEELCQPVFSAWLKMAFLTYLRTGFPTTSDYRTLDAVEWHPRSFPWVDPLKDAQSTILEMQNGMNTLHRICAAKGLDYDEVMDELQQEQEDRKKRGLVIGTDIRGNAVAATDPAAATAKEPGGGANPNALAQSYVMQAIEEDSDGWSVAAKLRSLISRK
jgi:lambda family phage portal protein